MRKETTKRKRPDQPLAIGGWTQFSEQQQKKSAVSAGLKGCVLVLMSSEHGEGSNA
jgi:hypothetical protein